MKGLFPIIDSEFPNDERYDLDSSEDCIALGLESGSNQDLKIADELGHYPWCAYAVVERKGSNLERAIIQIEHTTSRMKNLPKRPRIAIVIIGRLSPQEHRRYRWNLGSHELEQQRGGKWYHLRPHDSVDLKWYLFLEHQVQTQNRDALDRHMRGV